MQKNNQYDLKSVKLPRMAGTTLKVFARVLDNPAGRMALLGQLLDSAGLTKFRQGVTDDPPTFLPIHPTENTEWQSRTQLQAPDFDIFDEWPGRPNGFTYKTAKDYALAYREGRTTPEEVAGWVFEAMESSQQRDPRMNIFIAWNKDDLLAQARNATTRIKEGKALSLLDGVPVAVKDEVDMLPYPTTVGTRFLGKTPASQDSTVAARMRACGALLIGKTNMHEIGIGVTGLNPHHGTARNPVNPRHHTGGSSSGSAAAVAAGLCPIAIGADGGGSIRIPAAFCGVVGIKPTFGRVSGFGAAPLTWSNDQLGILAATPLDAALGYSIVAGPDPKDALSLYHPPVSLDKLTDLDLSDLTIGIYRPWFQHATSAIVDACEKMLAHLEKCGARVREIEIPGLEAARVAHLVSISSEIATVMDRYYAEHSHDFALETQIDLILARSLTARDYILAQRVRTRTIANFQAALKQVDVIVTPSTGVTAPPVREDAQPDGESDISLLTEIMRFAICPNVTGHPAISFPAGYDPQGLPVGFQAIGRPWEEHTLLRLAYAAEQQFERKAPQVFWSPLL